jgi:hypothetical protein
METPRLRLVPATAETLSLALNRRFDELGHRLHAQVEADPPLLDDN